MNTIKDGGPAFPKTELTAHHKTQVGMSLRDWFAGQALASIPCRSWEGATESTGKTIQQLWAKCAYAVADEMLAEREKETAK